MQRSRVHNSIRWRMMLSYLLITVIGFGIVLFSVTHIVETFMIDQRVGEMQSEHDKFTRSISSQYLNGAGETLYWQLYDKAQNTRGRYVLFDADAVVQLDSESQLNGQRFIADEVALVLWGGQTTAYGFYDNTVQTSENASFWDSLWSQKIRTAYYVQAIEKDGETVGALLLSALVQDVVERVEQIRTQIAIVLGTVLVAMMIASNLIAHSLTKPIVELTSVIRRMSRGEFNLRVKVGGSGELAELGKTFNTMSERLENTENFRNQFVSNASHEMKTPLSTMKILIESLLYQEGMDEKITREFLTDVNNEIDRLNTVITDLLQLVQSDKREAELKREPCDIADLCRNIIKRLAPIATQKDIQISSDLASVQMNVDKIKLDQAIFNLTENAVKYSDPGAEVNLSVSKTATHCLIQIRDQGIGIPQSDLEHIFERFYRVDKARSRKTGGTGLGLSIVDAIIKLHDGKIEVESEEGVGSVFTVWLPLQ